jgi:alpha-D-xyloside xylohydrolase
MISIPNTMKQLTRYSILAALIVAANYLPAQIVQPVRPEKVTDGVIFPIGDTFLKLEVWGDDIIRVAAANDRAFFNHSTPATMVRQKAKTKWKFAMANKVATITTAKVQARVDLASGNVSFFDSAGKPVLAEKSGGRKIVPVEEQGVKTFNVEQRWEPAAEESLYGLGQLQFGITDIKGYDLDLWQHNTCVVVPLLVSSRGYGVFWDNLSFTRFGDLREWEPIPTNCLYDAAGQAGGLTTGIFTTANADELQNARVTDVLGNARVGRAGGGARGGGWTRWMGELVPESNGEYQIRLYSNGGIKMWLDGKLVVDRWRQNWLTENDQVKLQLQAGHHYAIKIEHGGDQATTLRVWWKTPPPDNGITLWSQVGDGVDYYFIYGPSVDQVIAGMRQLTGQASMMPEWTFGLWQSRQRYETEAQLLDVVKEYRQRGIPFDNIVQDWQYWRPDSWGSHQFDPTRFPDPDGMIRTIHDEHAHIMISVWGKFYTGTTNFNELEKAGYLYQPNLKEGLHDWINYPYTFYDAFNPGARKLYWDQIDTALFRKGIDAWWEDATEPDLTASPPTLEGQLTHMTPTAAGPASRVLNGYALMNSMGVYEGQRGSAPNQRVFILTRSGFAGIQRYGTTTWSGDTTCTWTAMQKQIAAGLGYSVSGTPYWTMDIGGYTMENRFSAKTQEPANAAEWQELNARWFEFGAFCPFTRLHGELQPREPWAFGGDQSEAYKAILKFDHLRYRLLPYIYSLAGAAAHDSGTMMRPFVMDFPQDFTAREIADEYMFGPAFLVAPVTTYQARIRQVYLPQNDAGWYDFWTGAQTAGGKSIEAAAPYDAMPLYIRAGSIIPFGPEIQYVGEKQADPVTLYIYAGANGTFSFYEDDGVSYDYEKGAFASIPMQWNDATKTLSIGKRQGKFAGMLAKRTFNIVMVTKANPVGYSPAATPNKTLTYRGAAVSLKFN